MFCTGGWSSRVLPERVVFDLFSNEAASPVKLFLLIFNPHKKSFNLPFLLLEQKYFFHQQQQQQQQHLNGQIFKHTREGKFDEAFQRF